MNLLDMRNLPADYQRPPALQSATPYSLGKIDTSKLPAGFFDAYAAKDQGGRKSYALVPGGALGLDNNYQYAVYPDGRVEPVYQGNDVTYDPNTSATPDPGIRYRTLSELLSEGGQIGSTDSHGVPLLAGDVGGYRYAPQADIKNGPEGLAGGLPLAAFALMTAGIGSAAAGGAGAAAADTGAASGAAGSTAGTFGGALGSDTLLGGAAADTLANGGALGSGLTAGTTTGGIGGGALGSGLTAGTTTGAVGGGALGSGLTAAGAASGPLAAGFFGAETAYPVLGGAAAAQGASTVPAVTGSGVTAGTAAGAGAGASAVWNRILDGSATPGDYASVLGALAPGVLGYLGSSQQTDAFQNLANQYMGFGAPYREKLAQLYTPEGVNAYFGSPEVKQSVQLGTDALARALSTQGNPTGSGTALQQLQNYATSKFSDKLDQERDRLAGFGGLASYNAAAPAASSNAIASQGNEWNAIGYGVGRALNPQPSFADFARAFGIKGLA